MFFRRQSGTDQMLTGREQPSFAIPNHHAVLGTSLKPPFPNQLETAMFALGCFWGAERLFWQLPGVYSTAAGYMGGSTPNPTYHEVCSGRTGHAETVLVVFDPMKISYSELLKTFWEAHDPTQGDRQGNDIGSQYRSMIFTTTDEQRVLAEASRLSYDEALQMAGHRPITTEIVPAGTFYYAEEYHQQYLHKVPNGYCGLAGTGISCAVPQSSSANMVAAPVSGGDHDSDQSAGVITDPKLRPLPESENDWRQLLGRDQYRVLRQAATEHPFTGEFNAVWDAGLYRCGACGNPLFASETKYDHGCGWPSFGEALPGAVEYIEDQSHGMIRTEVRCARCHSHLGHVFDDGPRQYRGTRFCINSIALDFEPEQ